MRPELYISHLLEAGVAEDLLKRKDIAAVYKIVSSEGVAEKVDMQALYP